MFIEFFWQFIELVVNKPFRYLYRSGPKISSTLGFWGNSEDEEICAYLTGQSAKFWTTHIAQCTEMVESHMKSYESSLHVILYLYTIYSAFVFLVWKLKPTPESNIQPIIVCLNEKQLESKILTNNNDNKQ